MTENLPAQAERKPMTLRERLDKMTPEFKKALPGHIPAEKFVRTVQTAVQMNPQIGSACNTAGGIQSLMAACTKAATDGLILDGREAALVTFRQKTGDNQWEDRVQYIPMVAGLMKKARNSGEISNISAHVVYENDQFNYVLGDEERIEHAPKFGERGKAIAVYAIVKMKDGTVQREVMDKDAVMKIAAQSKNAAQYNPDTGKNYGEWWRKTVIRRISKYLPSSSDRDEFLQAVERIDDGFEYEAQDGGPTEPAAQPAKQRGAGAAKLKDITPRPDPEPQPEVQQRDEPPHDPQTGEIMDDTAPQAGDDI